MKDQVIARLKEVEEKLQQGLELESDDLVFLFGLSLLKEKLNG